MNPGDTGGIFCRGGYAASNLENLSFELANQVVYRQNHGHETKIDVSSITTLSFREKLEKSLRSRVRGFQKVSLVQPSFVLDFPVFLLCSFTVI